MLITFKRMLTLLTDQIFFLLLTKKINVIIIEITKQITGTKALIKQAHIFSRNKKTNIEKEIADLLDSLGIKYEFNKCVKTRTTFRFPDFTVGDLIIECDGMYWHQDKEKDNARQKELEELGFKVIRFNDEEILNDLIKVKEKIIQEFPEY